jgi:hypothetical protein
MRLFSLLLTALFLCLFTSPVYAKGCKLFGGRLFHRGKQAQVQQAVSYQSVGGCSSGSCAPTASQPQTYQGQQVYLGRRTTYSGNCANGQCSP